MMKKNSPLWLIGIAAIVFTSLLAYSCATPQPPQARTGPVDPDAGLSVVYFDEFYRNINQMPKTDRFGKPGQPIYVIDNKFGEGRVFGSKRSRGVGMHMTGFLLLDKPGVWEFKALSNDGIRVVVDGVQVIDDPDVHSDRMSKAGSVTVTSVGKKPIDIRYFQRKGTATLKLYWKSPESDGFSIIPASAYSH